MNASPAPGNPYVGPVPFKIEHEDLFFGREVEAKLLLSHVISERVVLFYAESGAGKSSLINAHLIPKLRAKKYQVLPVTRVGGELPPKSSYDYIYNVYAFNVLNALVNAKSAPGDMAALTLAALYKQRLLNDVDYEKPHWLIIDQFEEVVTTHIVQRAKRADFFDQLRDLLEADRMLSVVLVMREDHLAEVDDFAPRLPGRLGTRLRMERLKVDAAVDAVRLPAEKAGRTFAPEVARRLVEDLSQLRVADQEQPIKGDHVEPMQLQIVCHTLWERLNEAAAKGEETGVVTTEHLTRFARVDVALERFYDSAIERVVAQTTKATESDIRRWFGDTLITPSRIRAQVNRGFFTSGDLPNKVVDLLLETYLIRVVEARGGKWYELSHDRFINPILKSNIRYAYEGTSPLAAAAQNWVNEKNDESFLYRGARLREAQQQYLPHIERLSRLEREFLTTSINAESRRSRTLYATLGLVVILLLFTIVFAVYAERERRRVVQLQNQAKVAARMTTLEVEERIFGILQADRGKNVTAAEITTALEHPEAGLSLAAPTPEATPTPEESPTPVPPEQINTARSVAGSVRWALAEDGSLIYVDRWDAQNIVTVDIPQLRGVPGAKSGKVQFYRGAAAQLKAAWAEVEAKGLLDRVKQWDGSYARKAIGKSRLSIHALGLAFDINYSFNRTGQAPPPEGEEGSVVELVEIFKRYGFKWSGENRIPDGSHFEVERLTAPTPAPAS